MTNVCHAEQEYLQDGDREKKTDNLCNNDSNNTTVVVNHFTLESVGTNRKWETKDKMLQTKAK